MSNVLGIIYMTVNLTNNKKYVGRHVIHDGIVEDGYLGSGTALKNAVKEFGADQFKRMILQECTSYDELVAAEKYWIQYFDAVNNDEFYNLTDKDAACSGSNPVVMKKVWDSRSDAQKKHIGNKISSTRKEKNIKPPVTGWTSEQVKNIWDNRSNEYKNQIHEKMSATRKEKGSAAGENNPMFGRSAISEQKLRWYTNGVDTKYLPENTQPDGWVRGRTKRIKNEIH